MNDTTSRPDFAAFATALRQEAKWSATIHPRDSERGGSGQAASDQGALIRLAEYVELVGKRLGYL